MEQPKGIGRIIDGDNYMQKLIIDINRQENTKKVVRTRVEPVNNINNALAMVEAIGKTKSQRFVIDEENKWVFSQLTKWVQGDNTFESLNPKTLEKQKGDLTKGIYLAGSTGSGKSWALDIMSHFSKIDNIQVRCGASVVDMNYKTIRTDAICAEFRAGNSIEKYKAIPIVCFHDLASPSEPEESLFMGNRLKVMQSIIEARGDRQDLITLFTSNIPFDNALFYQRYGERCVSRMHEMCNYLQLQGTDRRMNII